MSRRILAINPGRVVPAALRDARAVMAVEFAYIAPLLVVFSAGLLELAIIMFDYHTATEATRRGIRTALTNAEPVVSLSDLTSAGITCSGTVNAVQCVGGQLQSASSFDAIVASMKALENLAIGNENVRVAYSLSGLDAPPEPGDTIAILTPLVTVSVVGLEHEFLLIPYTLQYPPFSTTRVAPSELVPIP